MAEEELELKLGDVVQLKSGGYKMTVEKMFSNSDRVVCVWFGGGELSRGPFSKTLLVKVSV